MRGIQIAYNNNAAKQVWEQICGRDLPKTRCTGKIVRIILLQHDEDVNESEDGRRIVFKKKSLGAGVYQVWMEAVTEKGGGS